MPCPPVLAAARGEQGPRYPPGLLRAPKPVLSRAVGTHRPWQKPWTKGTKVAPGPWRRQVVKAPSEPLCNPLPPRGSPASPGWQHVNNPWRRARGSLMSPELISPICGARATLPPMSMNTGLGVPLGSPLSPHSCPLPPIDER